MEGLRLLRRAQQAGMRVFRDGEELVMVGSPSQGSLAKGLLAAKSDVLSLLDALRGDRGRLCRLLRIPDWDPEWLVRTCADPEQSHPAVEGHVLTYGPDEIEILVEWQEQNGGHRMPTDLRNQLFEVKRLFGGKVTTPERIGLP